MVLAQQLLGFVKYKGKHHMTTINSDIKSKSTVAPMKQMFEYIPLQGVNKVFTLADEAYEHILRDIVFPNGSSEGTIQYAGKITESTIAKSLKMSNGPVREAIFRLRQEGWIHTVGNRGSFLVDFSDPKIAREIYMFRLSFETGAFYSVAASITPNQIKVLNAILNTLEKAIAEFDVESFRKADIEFHLKVVEYAGGKTFMRLFRSKLLQWYTMAFHVLMETMGGDQFSHVLEAPGTSTHKELFDAIRLHDSELAARLINKHYNHLADMLEIKHAVPCEGS